MSDQCEVLRIQTNSASAALDQANQAYMSCLPLDERVGAAQAKAKDRVHAKLTEAEQMDKMNRVMFRQLEHLADTEGKLEGLAAVARDTSTSMTAEIDDLKSQIRLERRRFLDSSPSATPAIGGLYFTKVPDNQVLIAFLSTFGAFWLFLSALFLMGKTPFDYLNTITMGSRVGVVGGLWFLLVLVTYIGFYVFT